VTGVLYELFLTSYVLFVGEEGNIPFYMFLYFELFILFFFAWFVIKKYAIGESEADKLGGENTLLKFLKRIMRLPDSTNLKIPIIIFFFGILFRITLFPTEISTSGDVYRYIWEGKVLYNGFNPYLISPNNPKLDNLHTEELPAKVTFKHLTAIYPPLAEIIFLIGYFISGESALGLKIIFLVCEIVTLIFLLKLFSLKEKNLNLVLLYAWLPLPILEYFINAHLDPLGIMFLVVFVYYMEKGKPLISALPFALSFLVKLLPIILFPLLIKKLGVKRTFYFAFIFLFISALFYLPFTGDNLSTIQPLLKYLHRWEFNGSIYNLFKYFFSDSEKARIFCGILLIISVGIIAIKYKDFIRASCGIFLSYIIFAATLYPWYLGWIAVLNPFLNFYSITSLLFTINFSNFTPLGEVWKEYFWVLLIQYVPFFILLAYDLMVMKIGKMKIVRKKKQ